MRRRYKRYPLKALLTTLWTLAFITMLVATLLMLQFNVSVEKKDISVKAEMGVGLKPDIITLQDKTGLKVNINLSNMTQTTERIMTTSTSMTTTSMTTTSTTIKNRSQAWLFYGNDSNGVRYVPSGNDGGACLRRD